MWRIYTFTGSTCGPGTVFGNHRLCMQGWEWTDSIVCCFNMKGDRPYRNIEFLSSRAHGFSFLHFESLIKAMLTTPNGLDAWNTWDDDEQKKVKSFSFIFFIYLFYSFFH